MLIYTLILSALMATPADIRVVSVGKPYKVNVAPAMGGIYTDQNGPQPFTAVNTFYLGELTDGTAIHCGGCATGWDAGEGDYLEIVIDLQEVTSQFYRFLILFHNSSRLPASVLVLSSYDDNTYYIQGKLETITWPDEYFQAKELYIVKTFSARYIKFRMDLAKMRLTTMSEVYAFTNTYLAQEPASWKMIKTSFLH
jgi:hypothetical protein